MLLIWFFVLYDIYFFYDIYLYSFKPNIVIDVLYDRIVFWNCFLEFLR